VNEELERLIASLSDEPAGTAAATTARLEALLRTMPIEGSGGFLAAVELRLHPDYEDQRARAAQWIRPLLRAVKPAELDAVARFAVLVATGVGDRPLDEAQASLREGIEELDASLRPALAAGFTKQWATACHPDEYSMNVDTWGASAAFAGTCAKALSKEGKQQLAWDLLRVMEGPYPTDEGERVRDVHKVLKGLAREIPPERLGDYCDGLLGIISQWDPNRQMDAINCLVVLGKKIPVASREVTLLWIVEALGGEYSDLDERRSEIASDALGALRPLLETLPGDAVPRRLIELAQQEAYVSSWVMAGAIKEIAPVVPASYLAEAMRSLWVSPMASGRDAEPDALQAIANMMSRCTEAEKETFAKWAIENKAAFGRVSHPIIVQAFIDAKVYDAGAANKMVAEEAVRQIARARTMSNPGQAAFPHAKAFLKVMRSLDGETLASATAVLAECIATPTMWANNEVREALNYCIARQDVAVPALAYQSLETALGAQYPEWRAVAADVLRQSNNIMDLPTRLQLLERLRPLMADPDEKVRSAAFAALVRLEARRNGVLPDYLNREVQNQLAAALAHFDDVDQRSENRSLVEIERVFPALPPAEASALIDRLIASTSSQHGVHRSRALWCLGRLVQSAPLEMVPRMMRAIDALTSDRGDGISTNAFRFLLENQSRLEAGAPQELAQRLLAQLQDDGRSKSEKILDAHMIEILVAFIPQCDDQFRRAATEWLIGQAESREVIRYPAGRALTALLSQIPPDLKDRAQKNSLPPGDLV